MDCGCFIAATGQAYPGPELAATAPTGVGGSLVASPLGEVLAEAGPDPQLVLCNVDVDSVPAIRNTVGVLHNRFRLRTDS
jgi:predicted amidohydrolase